MSEGNEALGTYYIVFAGGQRVLVNEEEGAELVALWERAAMLSHEMGEADGWRDDLEYSSSRATVVRVTAVDSGFLYWLPVHAITMIVKNTPAGRLASVQWNARVREMESELAAAAAPETE